MCRWVRHCRRGWRLFVRRRFFASSGTPSGHGGVGRGQRSMEGCSGRFAERSDCAHKRSLRPGVQSGFNTFANCLCLENTLRRHPVAEEPKINSSKNLTVGGSEEVFLHGRKFLKVYTHSIANIVKVPFCSEHWMVASTFLLSTMSSVWI